MSGAVSGAQFNFVPHASSGLSSGDDNGTKSTITGAGAAGHEFKGTRTLTPLASGAFSSQDQALAFRHQGENVLGAGAKNIGSWLFKSQD